MNSWIFMMSFIGLLIVVIGIFVIRKYKKEIEIRKKYPGYPKGYWMNQGIAIGVAIGAGIGVALNNIAIGTGVGIAIGAGIGSNLEQKHKAEIRPMVKEEIILKKQALSFTLGLVVLAVLAFIFVFVIMKK